MAVNVKRYTMLVGAQQSEDSTNIAYSMIHHNNSYGVPESMFTLTEEGFTMPNGDLYTNAEDILRKQIQAGYDKETGFIKIYLADIVYDSDLQITPTNVSILNKLESLDPSSKNVETKEMLFEIMKKYHIANTAVLRDKRVPAFGERDVLVIYFLQSVTNLGNLYEPRPMQTPYMNNLINFLKEIKIGIFV